MTSAGLANLEKAWLSSIRLPPAYPRNATGVVSGMSCISGLRNAWELPFDLAANWAGFDCARLLLIDELANRAGMQ
jgi:hypothetical protein